VPDLKPYEFAEPKTEEKKSAIRSLLRFNKQPTTTSEQVEKSDLVGGATSFHSLSWKDEKDVHVRPRTGRVLIFQHRNLLHSGQDLVQGEKYTMRTDLMYSLKSSQSETRSYMAGLDD
jgi:hypothetical protein